MSPTLIPAAAQALTAVLGLALLLWIASLRLRDASIADRFWPVFIALAGLIFALQGTTELDLRLQLMLAVTLAWALRLALFITWRNWGHGEDRRYRAMRERHAPHFARKSLVIVFGLQAVLAWIVSAPLFAARTAESAGPLTWAGGALALFGLVYEAVADAQLARFRADPAHRGQVMDRGLWRHTRHPNYFGEACVWWGLWTMVAATGWPGWLAVVSPLLMTLLLLRVSGVSLLEEDISERRPAYRAYVARTNAFFPGPRRRTPA